MPVSTEQKIYDTALYIRPVGAPSKLELAQGKHKATYESKYFGGTVVYFVVDPGPSAVLVKTAELPVRRETLVGSTRIYSYDATPIIDKAYPHRSEFERPMRPASADEASHIFDILAREVELVHPNQ